MSFSIVGLWHVSSVSFLHFVKCTTKLDQLDLVLIQSNKQDIVHFAFYKHNQFVFTSPRADLFPSELFYNSANETSFVVPETILAASS